MKTKRWEIISKETKKPVIDVLLQNRGLKSEKERNDFFNPKKPDELTLSELGISKVEIGKVLKRLVEAKKKKEKIIIYGDYDADGISATAILWECLYGLGFDVMPYIPDRFEEGYGINAGAIAKLNEGENKIGLVITVDNGIVASSEIKKITKFGIDVIVTDHHEPGKVKPKATAIVHTQKICGSAVAWIFAREIQAKIKNKDGRKPKNSLELAGIGTVADQMPLLHANRSFALWGLSELNKTKRAGLLALIKESGLKPGEIEMYGINYVIAPRINSMGRLTHGIDSLRLLCTNKLDSAESLAHLVAKTNLDRQRIVDEVLLRVKSEGKKFSKGIIFLSHEDYHEGVIGLAAGRLVEEFYRPAIVISKGKKFSKGSARSISGLNIIEVIRAHEDMIVAGGGHPMAAGFTIETAKLLEFEKALNKTAEEYLTDETLTRRLKIDLEISFDVIDWDLVKKIKKFEPTGLGNPAPSFVTFGTEVVDSRILGNGKKHLKLKLKEGGKFFDAIGFGMGEIYSKMQKGVKVDVVYNIEENVWNGTRSIQLKLRDLRIS